MIELFGVRRLVQSSRRDDPVVLAESRAALPCGCQALVGRRTDTMEPVTVLLPCSFRHEPLITDTRKALQESLREAPSARPMVEVCDRLLAEAAVGRTL